MIAFVFVLTFFETHLFALIINLFLIKMIVFIVWHEKFTALHLSLQNFVQKIRQNFRWAQKTGAKCNENRMPYSRSKPLSNTSCCWKKYLFIFAICITFQNYLSTNIFCNALPYLTTSSVNHSNFLIWSSAIKIWHHSYVHINLILFYLHIKYRFIYFLFCCIM